MSEQCARCGKDVPPVLGPPPGDSDRWTRFQIRMVKREVVYTLRLAMIKRRWLPPRAADQTDVTWTDLTLCDWCAGDVFLFAQGLSRGPDSAGDSDYTEADLRPRHPDRPGRRGGAS